MDMMMKKLIRLYVADAEEKEFLIKNEKELFAVCDLLAEDAVKREFAKAVRRFLNTNVKDAAIRQGVFAETMRLIMENRLLKLRISGIFAAYILEKEDDGICELEAMALVRFRMKRLLKKAEETAEIVYAAMQQRKREERFAMLAARYVDEAEPGCREVELILAEEEICLYCGSVKKLCIYADIPGLYAEEICLSCLLQLMPKKLMIKGAGHEAFVRLVAKIFGKRAHIL